MKIKYLFIRILEACNAGCWFCGFARSKDSFRIDLDEYTNIILEAKAAGVEYIRLTGGETLLHKDINHLINIAHMNGMRTSIITNGFLLSNKIEELSSNGLDQVIVSIDDIPEYHNEVRKLTNLFDRAMDGIKKAKKLGVKVRINTVCGPHNYKSMPELQKVFTDNKIDYWELSALKLEEKIIYPESINEIVNKVYMDDKKNKKLIPFGKKWCGNTEDEVNLYLQESIPPRASGKCHMVSYIRYYDAKNRNLYVCSLLAHRGLSKKYFRNFHDDESFSLRDEETVDIANYFYHNGPKVCTGCSSTAAGCSDMLSEGKEFYEWMY